jgi:hypothetical protein
MIGSGKFLLATAVLAATCGAPARAEPGCGGAVSGSSAAHHALTPAFPGATAAAITGSYARAFAAARAEAIAAWSAKVGRECRGASRRWRQARETVVAECDRAMGGRFSVCAQAVPAGVTAAHSLGRPAASAPA